MDESVITVTIESNAIHSIEWLLKFLCTETAFLFCSFSPLLYALENGVFKSIALINLFSSRQFFSVKWSFHKASVQYTTVPGQHQHTVSNYLLNIVED